MEKAIKYLCVILSVCLFGCKSGHEKFCASASNIILYIEDDLTLGWPKYDPYVTFVNNNNKEVTIMTSSQDTETKFYQNIDMFVLKPNEKVKKYIGIDNFNSLFTIEVIITTNQGTVEKINLWGK